MQLFCKHFNFAQNIIKNIAQNHILCYNILGGDKMEIWKQIKNLHYSISNIGNIRNDNTGKQLKPQKNSFGYLSILLYDNGKPVQFRIHRLVLEAFNPVENMQNLQVNHIDHNRENNRLQNLEWTTPKENCNKKKLRKFYNSKGCYDNKGNYFSSFREARTLL